MAAMHISRLALAALFLIPPFARAQQQAPKAPSGPDRPLSAKLRSPRDTLQTLYYAIDTYDYYPTMIREAVACLDLHNTMPADSASADLLAVQLECILKSLEIPLGALPDSPTGEPFVITLFGDGQSKPIPITIKRGVDGLWRFDSTTVDAVPAMHRIVAARQKDLIVERSALRENYTDARATVKRFMGDCYTGNFAAAANALDLSRLSTAERRERGPALAQMLAFVLQRRGYVYSQLLPNAPTAPGFTWHADADGRIMLERVHPSEGKDAWLFNRHTVSNLPRMYAAAQHAIPDACYVRLGLVVPPLQADGSVSVTVKRPASVPDRLASPRALLHTFFRAMDMADSNDARLSEALECMDLGAIPDADRRALGASLADRLDAVLRAVQLDIAAVPDTWDAATQTLGDGTRLKVELVREKDGCWRFSDNTIARLPEQFEKLNAKERGDRERSGQYESARDTIVTFIDATHHGDFEQAATCLDLSAYLPGAQDEIGRVLAYKLKYVLDRTGRVYAQETPNAADGPHYTVYRGDLGRIVLGKKSDGARKDAWLFTADTVNHIERMFREVADRPPDASLAHIASVHKPPEFMEVPGLWLRHRLPPAAQMKLGPLEAYQWAGLVLAMLVTGAFSHVVLGRVQGLAAWILHKGGSTLTTHFVSRQLRPLTWLFGLWLCFRVLTLLDLPANWFDDVLAIKKFLLAGLFGWLGCRLVDLVLAIYSGSELLKPHRGLGDMIAPVTVKFAKSAVVLCVMVYVIYQVGQGDMLGRFLTGLGVAGLAASLAAQDALKSFFGTLLLIGERSFKIGDRIIVGNQEGVVEQVGFRSTRLRTPEDSLLTIPNSVVSNASIDNMGARSYRRFKASILIHYRTPLERVTKLRDRLERWLTANPNVRKDKIDVAIQRLADNGLELALSLYLAPTDGVEERRLKDAINVELLRAAEQEGVGLTAAGPPPTAVKAAA
jgi:MscS family membrane protein